ncbi:WD repeat-containing protein 91-like [Xenopus laevis]|uniref:WD repeat-containing protein 91-like n=1 Tax=Xenopus laevis TaxID=8355 RepID=A0A8J1MJ03_XENLA|nr:WD repeat-containing protein 91-like [Xenopus laevis]XP_041441357.1 WD repeat-containing protein 91-like [Xenopus laevis]
MHCRVDCSGCRVASVDVDGVIKIWSIDGIMQTKASAISKSALLSLEWTTKRDRLISCKRTATQNCSNEDFFVPSAV